MQAKEVRFGINEGARLFEIELQKKVGRSEEQATILRHLFAGHLQQFYNQDAFDTYVFCLSEHDKANTDGRLSMWRGYGQHGNGAAIVFDPGAVTLVPTSPLIISKVSYASDTDRAAQVAKLVEQWATLAARARLPNDKLFLAASAAFTAITLLSLTTKHRGFSEEVEWRVIYLPERDRAGLLKEFMGYHIGDRGVEPKLKFPVGPRAAVTASDLTLENMVERIILGPSVSSPLAKRSIERMLEKIGKSEFVKKLYTSGIPLRPVSGGSF